MISVKIKEASDAVYRVINDDVSITPFKSQVHNAHETCLKYIRQIKLTVVILPFQTDYKMTTIVSNMEGEGTMK